MSRIKISLQLFEESIEIENFSTLSIKIVENINYDCTI
jgi:hypothetical protein